MSRSSFALRLTDEPDAVPSARRFVRERLAGIVTRNVAADCELVAGELITNALLHGVPPVELEVSVDTDVIRIAVADGSRSAPVRALSGRESMTGRGLALVAALSRSWMVEPRSDGKVVIAEVPIAGADATEQAGPDFAELLAEWPDLEEEPVERYSIQLGDVPTDLLLAAKAHVDNLVREFALAASGASTGATAGIPLHLAELIETVTTRFAAARQSIKRQALAAAAAGAPRTRLELVLPLSAADAGEAYLAALDQADAYARAARLLTLETPPQHRAFRRWYLTALIARLRHAAAGLPAPPVPTFEEFLLGELREVASAQRTSDHAARLQAVTAALARATTQEQVAEVVVSEGVVALGASGGSLFVPADGDHVAVPGAVGYAAALVDRLRAERRDADLPAAYALRTGEAVWLESKQERETRFPALTGLEPGTVAMCAVPLVTNDDIVGALRFSFSAQRLFDDNERRFVTALAAQTALALERARLFTVERDFRLRADRADVGDSFGAMLLAAAEAGGRPGVVFEVIERDDGHVRAADAARYFEPSWGPLDDWVYERVRGRVLDVGCGAGRNALELQARGLEVTALDVSPGAIELCRRRGVRDTWCGSITDLPDDRRFDTVLLLGNNIGLLGGRHTAREFLERLAEVAGSPGAQILGTGLAREPGASDDPADVAYERSNAQRGRLPWQVTMRSRFGRLTTDWFDYLFVRPADLADLLASSPWQIAERFEAGTGYAVRLTLRG